MCGMRETIINVVPPVLSSTLCLPRSRLADWTHTPVIFDTGQSISLQCRRWRQRISATCGFPGGPRNQPKRRCLIDFSYLRPAERRRGCILKEPRGAGKACPCYLCRSNGHRASRKPALTRQVYALDSKDGSPTGRRRSPDWNG